MERRILVAEVLREQGRSQRWLARQLGIHESLLSRILHHRYPLRPWFIERCCDALSLPESVLFPLVQTLPSGTDMEPIGKEPRHAA